MFCNFYYFVYTPPSVTFLVVAHYLLELTGCLLLVVKSLVASSKIWLLLVAEVSHCKKSLITHCGSCWLQKIASNSLQNSFVTLCRSCSFKKFTHLLLQNSLVTCCRSFRIFRICQIFLLVEVSRYKKSMVSPCKIHLLFVAEGACCKKLFVTYQYNHPLEFSFV